MNDLHLNNAVPVDNIHNTMDNLHNQPPVITQTTQPHELHNVQCTRITPMTTYHNNDNKHIPLMTLIAYLNNTLQMRCLIDTGSQIDIISPDIVKTYNLQTYKTEPIRLQYVGNKVVTTDIKVNATLAFTTYSYKHNKPLWYSSTFNPYVATTPIHYEVLIGLPWLIHNVKNINTLEYKLQLHTKNLYTLFASVPSIDHNTNQLSITHRYAPTYEHNPDNQSSKSNLTSNTSSNVSHKHSQNQHTLHNSENLHHKQNETLCNQHQHIGNNQLYNIEQTSNLNDANLKGNYPSNSSIKGQKSAECDQETIDLLRSLEERERREGKTETLEQHMRKLRKHLNERSNNTVNHIHMHTDDETSEHIYEHIYNDTHINDPHIYLNASVLYNNSSNIIESIPPLSQPHILSQNNSTGDGANSAVSVNNTSFSHINTIEKDKEKTCKAPKQRKKVRKKKHKISKEEILKTIKDEIRIIR